MKNIMTMTVAILLGIAISVQFSGCGSVGDTNEVGALELEEGLGTPEESVDLAEEGDDVKLLGSCPQDISCPNPSPLGSFQFASRITGGVRCWYSGGQTDISAPGCPYCCVKYTYPPNCWYTYFPQPWTCN